LSLRKDGQEGKGEERYPEEKRRLKVEGQESEDELWRKRRGSTNGDVRGIKAEERHEAVDGQWNMADGVEWRRPRTSRSRQMM